MIADRSDLLFVAHATVLPIDRLDVAVELVRPANSAGRTSRALDGTRNEACARAADGVRCITLVAGDGTNEGRGSRQARATPPIQSPERYSPCSADDAPLGLALEVQVQPVRPTPEVPVGSVAALLPLPAVQVEGRPPPVVEERRPALP